ncbi:hypothetical protein HCN44_003890 [Aphidius gifuensis]|uniref:Uncharacterized protein n=1 Tax=Aphidius gifuensis TaxID=684658 RepID=A0A834XY35_APHGI|nr:hypothetical protein HCN44_003890 [Aphidius gifuensis]
MVFNKNIFSQFSNEKYNQKCQDEFIKKCTSDSFVDGDNVFRSCHENFDTFKGSYLHEIIWKDVDKWWDKTALVCSTTHRSYTYAQLRKLSGKFATSLRKLNIKPNETVAVILPNIPEFAIVTLGASEAGIQIKNQLKNSETVAVVSVLIKHNVIIESINDVASIRHPPIYVNDEKHSQPSGTINFDDLIADCVQEFYKTGDKIGVNAMTDTAVLPYSSGTTGLPKGVEITHRNLVTNLAQFHHEDCKIIQPAVGNFQEVIPLVLPLFHAYGFSVVLCPGLSLLDNNKSTLFFLVPPIIQLMINDDRFTKKHTNNLRQIITCASVISNKNIAKLRTKFGNEFIFSQGYGLTETTTVITIGNKNSPCTSVGRLMPNTLMKIIGRSDDNLGKCLGVDKIGEVLVKGSQVTKGYFKNPQATLDTIQDGWLKTGDLGSFDENENLTLHGRIKEIIKVNGMQVSPTELELLFHQHDKISDVAVIGIPHERSGEILKAFIVKKKGAVICENDVKKYLATRAARYKQIEQVVFVDKIPKDAAGKILRKQLRYIDDT